MRKLYQIAVIAVLSASTTAGFAAPDLAECVNIEAPSERLFCYDQYAGRSTKKATAPLPQTATGTPDAALPATRDQTAHADSANRSDNNSETGTTSDAVSFGLNKKREPVSKQDYVTAKIVNVQSSPTGAQIITLSNGQVWIENERGKRPIESQQTVTIRKQRFNYKMLLESQPDVAVRRLQ